MSFNKFMHPRNIYRQPPDFKDLANKYPEFEPFVTYDASGKSHVDFRSHDALRVLTKTLLKNDFKLEVEIPPARLIPTLPSRLNYILWLEDLLETIPKALKTAVHVHGIDIGTGSTCVYPLIGAKKNGWKFLASDADEAAVNFARQNVERNKLQELIEIVKVSSTSCLSEAIGQTENQFEFSMCNPPFFVTDEANPYGKGRTSSRPPPKTVNCPTETEAVTDGGEVNLIMKMLQESLILKDKIKIYSSMMGKKQSLKVIKKALIDQVGKGISNFTSTEFCQGHTIRWGIAWTCVADIHLDRVVTPKRPKEVIGKPISFEITHSDNNPDANMESILERVIGILNDLKIHHTQLKANKYLVSLHCTAKENTWSNQRRKRRALIQQTKQIEINSEADPNVKNQASPSICQPIATVDAINGEDKAVADEKERSAKKRSFGEIAVEDSELESESLIQCLITLRKVHKHFIFEMQWISGTIGKEGCHQVMQYFKNKLG